jgi:hypothetical protein
MVLLVGLLELPAYRGNRSVINGGRLRNDRVVDFRARAREG